MKPEDFHDPLKQKVTLNPHDWRKCEQAQTNMMRQWKARGRHHHRRRTRYWSRIFLKLSNRVVERATVLPL